MAEAPPAAAASSEPETWYELDADDRITRVGGHWRDFALAGPDEAPTGESVVGTPVLEHVSGHFTKKYLKEFLQLARISGRAARSTYRCDSPSVKRLMEMRAEADGSGALRVTHRTLDERPLPFPIPVVEVAKRAIAAVLRCSVCNRLRRGTGAAAIWREPEAVAKPDAGPTRVIHTVCADCRSGISARERWGPMAPAPCSALSPAGR